MGTLFEAIILGERDEHARALANGAEEEICTFETIFSRFDASSELSRLNRSANGGSVRVSPEMWDLLSRCEDARQWTGGHFDVTLGSGAIEFDTATRTVRLTNGAQMDLGAIGKGEALDRIAERWRQQGVRNVLLHAGTSSIVALGESTDHGWPIDIRDPFREDGPPVARLHLRNSALSCSAATHPGQSTSDVLRPSTGKRLTTQVACVVLAETAAVAEILSTALLVAGREEAERERYWQRWPGTQVAWIDECSAITWLTETP